MSFFSIKVLVLSAYNSNKTVFKTNHGKKTNSKEERKNQMYSPLQP
jgi:hypothetical protein